MCSWHPMISSQQRTKEPDAQRLPLCRALAPACSFLTRPIAYCSSTLATPTIPITTGGELPGGGADPGETLTDTAIHEVAEKPESC